MCLLSRALPLKVLLVHENSTPLPAAGRPGCRLGHCCAPVPSASPVCMCRRLRMPGGCPQSPSLWVMASAVRSMVGRLLVVGSSLF
jgi:hypothetical protein